MTSRCVVIYSYTIKWTIYSVCHNYLLFNYLKCWQQVSAWYDPFSIGASFETYEPPISLIFNSFFFSPGHDELRIIENAGTELAGMGTQLYIRTRSTISDSLKLALIP
jgi:hypothetical protein